MKYRPGPSISSATESGIALIPILDDGSSSSSRPSTLASAGGFGSSSTAGAVYLITDGSSVQDKVVQLNLDPGGLGAAGGEGGTCKQAGAERHARAGRERDMCTWAVGGLGAQIRAAQRACGASKARPSGPQQ